MLSWLLFPWRKRRSKTMELSAPSSSALSDATTSSIVCSTASIEKVVQLDFDSLNDEGLSIPAYAQIKPVVEEVVQVPSQNHKLQVVSSKTKFYTKLIEDAPHIYGDFNTSKKQKLPPWLNLVWLEDGSRFVQKHFYSIFLFHLVSIFITLTLRPIQAILLRSKFQNLNTLKNGCSSRCCSISPSLLCTFQFIIELKDVYEEIQVSIDQIPEKFAALLIKYATNFKKYLPPLSTDLVLNNTEKFQYENLREEFDLHCGLSDDKLKTFEHPKLTLNPCVPLSQYDLAIVHFTFFSLPIRFGTLFNLKWSGNKDLRGFVHLWAAIGYFLGIQDQHNTALKLTQILASTLSTTSSPSIQKANDEEWKNLAEELHEDILKFSFTQVSPLGYKLWSILINNLKSSYCLSCILPVSTINELIRLTSKHVFKTPVGTLTFIQKGMYFKHRLLCYFCIFWLGRIILNALLKWALIFLHWFYIKRSKEDFDNISKSTLSLTRSIRWTSKGDGIVA